MKRSMHRPCQYVHRHRGPPGMAVSFFMGLRRPHFSQRLILMFGPVASSLKHDVPIDADRHLVLAVAARKLWFLI